MKVVINKCFGGFGLSPKAVARLAELRGRDCYFYETSRDGDGRLDFSRYRGPLTTEQAEAAFVFFAFDVPNANDLLRYDEPWSDMTMDERRAHNENNANHTIESRDMERHDPMLVQVVEELGGAAGGKFAQLEVVEIPDGVEYEISEYDGLEHIAEKHRTWG